jgi:alpha-1,3-rhamnosyl/mannosyltransferase
MPGYVDKNDLPAIYAGAIAYAAPSYYEGFGLTLLEAMSQGVPVVTSNRYSLPEVAGDAALFVRPDDSEGLADALYKVVFDTELRARLIERGYERVRSFSWEATAQATLRAYTDACKHGQ